MTRKITTDFKPFTGSKIAQASGAVQLAPDRFIIIDDRKNKFFHALLDTHNRLTASELTFDNSNYFSLEDMEGVARKPDDSWIYVITSYSGSKKKRRRRLVRFQVQKNGNITGMESAENAVQLKDTIRACLRKRFNSLPKKFAFNIEGLSWSADAKELLIGLRSPVIEGQAIILRTSGIEKAFSNGSITFPNKDIATLDLHGGGVRAMAYISDLGGYLLVSGKGKEAVKDHKGKGRNKGYYLWFWDGRKPAREILRFPKTTGIPRDEIQPEAVCEVVLPDGITRTVLIVSDDGDLGENAAGKYWLLSQKDYTILQNL